MVGGPGATSRPTPSPPGCWSARTLCRSRGRTRTQPPSPGTEGWSVDLGQRAYSPAQDSLPATVVGLLTLTCGLPTVKYNRTSRIGLFVDEVENLVWRPNPAVTAVGSL